MDQILALEIEKFPKQLQTPNSVCRSFWAIKVEVTTTWRSKKYFMLSLQGLSTYFYP